MKKKKQRLWVLCNRSTSELVSDIDLKILLTYVDAAAEVGRWEQKYQEMRVVPRINGTQVFLAEILLKFRGWHAKRIHVSLQRVGGRLEVWLREFA